MKKYKNPLLLNQKSHFQYQMKIKKEEEVERDIENRKKDQFRQKLENMQTD